MKRGFFIGAIIIAVFIVFIVYFLLGGTYSSENVNTILDPGSYIACGCGCCYEASDIEEVCLYKSQGDDIREIIESDEKIADSSDCALVGCRLGVRYSYCD